MLVEITGMVSVGGITRDTNGDNLNVELQTRMFESDNILFVPSLRSNAFTVYFNSKVHEHKNKFRGTVVVYKNAKGHRHTFKVSHYHYGDHEDNLKVLSRVFDAQKESPELTDILDDLQNYRPACKDGARAFAESKGIYIETVMPFTHTLWIIPKFIKENKNTLEVGWQTFDTYASHPMSLKITKKRNDTSLVRLVDIGAEESGYYAHHNKHTCRPEDAAKIKAFARRFKAQVKKVGAQ